MLPTPLLQNGAESSRDWYSCFRSSRLRASQVLWLRKPSDHCSYVNKDQLFIFLRTMPLWTETRRESTYRIQTRLSLQSCSCAKPGGLWNPLSWNLYCPRRPGEMTIELKGFNYQQLRARIIPSLSLAFTMLHHALRSPWNKAIWGVRTEKSHSL